MILDELGNDIDYDKTWIPKDAFTAFNIVSDNMKLLEYTFQKIGNELELSQNGFKILGKQKDKNRV